MPTNRASQTTAAWYRLTPEEAFDRLASDARGLSSAEAKHRLELHGENALSFKRAGWFVRLLRQFDNPLVYILLISVFLTMPLMMEPKERHILERPPRPSGARIVDALFIRRVLMIGLAIALPTFLVFHHFGAGAVSGGVVVDALRLTQAQTAAFWAVLLVHFGFVMSARSVNRSAFRFSPFSNPWLLGGIAASFLVRLLPTFVPSVGARFRTAAFPADWWWWILPCLLPGFVVLELDKLIRSR